MNRGLYANYFEWRGVSESDYRNFSLPAYLIGALPKDKSVRIVDYGCGFGQMLGALTKLGYSNAIGVDIEPKALQYCKDSGLNVLDGMDNVNLRMLESSADVVIMSHVLEHFPKQEIIPRLRQVKDYLKSGGILIAIVPNAQSNTGCYWAYEDFTHETLFTSGSLFFVLKASGFSKIDFIDVDCIEGRKFFARIIRKLLLPLYRLNYQFWNKITGSQIYAPSPMIFSWEIKAVAR